MLGTGCQKPPKKPGFPGFFIVRPAWAHSCGCQSCRKLIPANEVKRNRVRASERREEARIVIGEPMDKNRIEGTAERGEWAMDYKALVSRFRCRAQRLSRVRTARWRMQAFVSLS